MLSANSIQKSQTKLSCQMRAVLLIVEADPYFKNAVLPFIDLERESIGWNRIFKIPFGSGHKAAAHWMFSVWTDEVGPKANPFDAALSMSVDLQMACLKALALRWGIYKP